MKDISYRVALGGIVSALCLVTMFLAGIMPALYILLPMIAGVFLMIIAEEVSTKWALLTYISTGILSMFITADKEAALLFVMIFGHYPIIRYFLQRIRFSPLRFAVKLIVFNAGFAAFFYTTVYLFSIEQMLESINGIGRYGWIAALIVCNFIFVMYDYLLDRICIIYRHRMRPKFMKKK